MAVSQIHVMNITKVFAFDIKNIYVYRYAKQNIRDCQITTYHNSIAYQNVDFNIKKHITNYENKLFVANYLLFHKILYV